MRISHKILGLARVKAFAQTHHHLSQFCMIIVLGAAMACFTVQARASHEIEALRAYQACFPWGGCHRPLPGASALEVCQNYTIGRVLGRFNPPIFGPDVYACNAPYIFNANGECHPAYCGAYAIVAWAPYCPAGYSLYRFDVATNWYTCLRLGPHEEQQYQIALSLSTGSPESGTILTSVEPDKTTDSMVAKVYDNNGQVVPNAKVRLAVDVQPYSGGHQHDEGRHSNSMNENHVGKLAPVSLNAGTVTENGKVLTGSTGSNGLRFTFTAPSPAGDHKIKASCTDGKNCKLEGPDTVWVGVKYLHPATDSPNYVLIIPNKDTNHPDNHNLTGAANAALEELAIRYHLEFPNSPVLYLNDSSLERGGLFDIAFNCDTYSGTCSRSKPWWTPPHSEHRRGVVIDIRANETSTAIPPQNYGRFKAIANGLYMNVKDETDLGHFHVRLLGLAQ